MSSVEPGNGSDRQGERIQKWNDPFPFLLLFLVVGGWGELDELRELPGSLEQGYWVGRCFQQVEVRRAAGRLSGWQHVEIWCRKDAELQKGVAKKRSAGKSRPA